MQRWKVLRPYTLCQAYQHHGAVLKSVGQIILRFILPARTAHLMKVDEVHRYSVHLYTHRPAYHIDLDQLAATWPS